MADLTWGLTEEQLAEVSDCLQGMFTLGRTFDPLSPSQMVELGRTVLASLTLTVRGRVKCTKCGGSGRRRTPPKRKPPPERSSTFTCDHCQGSGDEPCDVERCFDGWLFSCGECGADLPHGRYPAEEGSPCCRADLEYVECPARCKDGHALEEITETIGGVWMKESGRRVELGEIR